ncbi:MAG: response regulator [Elusimicrobia bacterium]|nr:response regulator [Elusimicrobiota bacterium]
MAKIIVADDDSGIAELIKFTFENEGHNVKVFRNGLDAYEAVLKEMPDLVILDVMMPKMNGYEVCEKLKGVSSTRLIPVIILTSQSQTKDKLTGLKLGADDYITKPFDSLELLARAEGIINRYSETRAVNPLTGLPGNVSIEKEVSARIGAGKKFAVLWIDLDNFKSYNDNYGFEKGDVIIKQTAKFIIDAVHQLGTSEDMIGHVGGDDFIVVTEISSAENICKEIIKHFDENIASNYSEEDRTRGYIVSKDRLGKVQAFPIMSISIGIVSNEIRNFIHYAQLAETAAEVKAVAKGIPKSSYFKDRRKD